VKTLLHLRPYFQRYRWPLLRGILYILLSAAFGVVSPMLIRDAVDGLRSSIDGATLARYAAMIAGVSAISGVFLYLTRQSIIVISRHIEYDLRNDFLHHVVALPQRFFQGTTTGDLMAQATNDISAVRMFVGPAVMYTADTVFTVCIVVVLLVGIHPMLTLWALLPLPLVSFLVNRLGGVIHTRFEDIQSFYGSMTARAQESIAGVRVVRAYRREEFESTVFADMSEEYRRRNMLLYRVQSLFMPVLVVLVGFSIIVVVWLGGIEVIRGRLTLGELMQFLIYLGMLTWPVAAMGWVMNLVQRAAASMKRLLSILQEESEIADGPDTDTGITALRGDIEFRDVHFRYGAAGPDVLNGLNLRVPAGRSLAIIGPTGCGKSSLVQLLPRLRDVTGGTLLIDGHDIRHIPLAALRAHIAVVTQETFLFSDTLAHNITYGVDGEQIADMSWAAEVAQLDKDVRDFPKGYDTVLGERGITLSGGQKQRVSIARAVLRRPAILILDDALSAVDTHTEEDILQRLRAVMAERTSIIVSHRVSTVKHADLIVVLDGGTIRESGSHEELLAHGGMYADLYRRQLLAEELQEIE
jgi:ATP-binding cassette, subfamily B, multidrug efflux pump